MLVDWLEKNQLSCVIKSNFGVDCPGCGTQRSVIALLNGDIISSIELHPGVILFFLTAIATILQLFINHKSGGRIIMYLFVTTVVATLINFILKFFH